MGSTKRRADFIFSVSWEVCNKVGGIYTVLSTQAKTLKETSGATLVYIGPDLWKGKDNPLFEEDDLLYADWQNRAWEIDGLSVRIGHWLIPGKPIVFLVDFMPFFAMKDWIYSRAWELFRVDSLHAYGDYDEASMFSYAAAMVVRSFLNYNVNTNDKVIYHAHEWMTGMGALFIKHFEPRVSTVFTTHATSVGRSICGNNKNLYEFFDGYNGDQMAAELNIESKHSIEKQTAHRVDCFTTVSDITARECTQLLERTPDVITVNGFEDSFVPGPEEFDVARKAARKRILSVAGKLTSSNMKDDTVIIGIGGRYEFRNKGIDLFLESMRCLRDRGKTSDRQILALIQVPGWVLEPRKDLYDRLKLRSHSVKPMPVPVTTHWLHNMSQDKILSTLSAMGFRNKSRDNIKIVFVPCYLDGNDGIFDMTYYELLIGQDLAIYPSYYEPWGYTPLESTAFKVPTITSDLAGFGIWVNSVVKDTDSDLLNGVHVIHRDDSNYFQAAQDIALTVEEWVAMDEETKMKVRESAGALARRALWKNFIEYYLKAYSIALEK